MAVNQKQVQPGIAKLNMQYVAPMPQALQAIPEDIARRYNVLPMALENNTLRVFKVNPRDILTIENLSIYTRKRIQPIAASLVDIKEGIDYNYSSIKGPSHLETFTAGASETRPAEASKLPAEEKAATEAQSIGGLLV